MADIEVLFCDPKSPLYVLLMCQTTASNTSQLKKYGLHKQDSLKKVKSSQSKKILSSSSFGFSTKNNAI
jgi:hypothetical protein